VSTSSATTGSDFCCTTYPTSMSTRGKQTLLLRECDACITLWYAFIPVSQARPILVRTAAPAAGFPLEWKRRRAGRPYRPEQTMTQHAPTSACVFHSQLPMPCLPLAPFPQPQPWIALLLATNSHRQWVPMKTFETADQARLRFRQHYIHCTALRTAGPQCREGRPFPHGVALRYSPTKGNHASLMRLTRLATHKATVQRRLYMSLTVQAVNTIARTNRHDQLLCDIHMLDDDSKFETRWQRSTTMTRRYSTQLAHVILQSYAYIPLKRNRAPQGDTLQGRAV